MMPKKFPSHANPYPPNIARQVRPSRSASWSMTNAVYPSDFGIGLCRFASGSHADGDGKCDPLAATKLRRGRKNEPLDLLPLGIGELAHQILDRRGNLDHAGVVLFRRFIRPLAKELLIHNVDKTSRLKHASQFAALGEAKDA